MCRFLAYIGDPIVVDELLIKPENSLVNQSYDAEEMSQTLNGDGFGLGWYVREVREYPGLFRSITPAWNNHNLLYNASLIRTDCLFAHVRAASVGGIAEFNCHPFHYKQYLMMHNGGIEDFPRIKRKLLERLSEEVFLWIQGQTDSEHIFALLMQHLSDMKKPNVPLTAEEVASGFQHTFDVLAGLREEAGIADEVSAYNMMITDGKRIFGTRYSSQPDKVSPTLYYATGSRFAGKGEMGFLAESDESGHNHSVLIVSEKLTLDGQGWIPIPPNHFIAVDHGLEVKLLPLN